MRTLFLFSILILTIPRSSCAQEPVNRLADWSSYGTAVVNPTLGVIGALRSSDPKCQLGRLALSEGLGNGVTALIKTTVHSPRPCLGCPSDGMPSGHTMNSAVGANWHPRFGLSFTLSTGDLRTAANRHTPAQVVAGALLGIAADYAPRLFLHCGD